MKKTKIYRLLVLSIVFLFPLFGIADQCKDFFTPRESTKNFEINWPTSEQKSWMKPISSDGEMGSRRVDRSDYTIDIGAPNANQIAKGAMFKVRKKTDVEWESHHGPFDAAPQGDPRWPFKVLGPEVSALLGFEMPDSNTVIVPTVDRINWGIRKLNTWLTQEGKRPIPYSFYEQRDDIEFNYANEAQNGRIPVNMDNFFLTVHDIFYHTLVVGEHPMFFDRRLKSIEIINFLSSRAEQLMNHENEMIDAMLALPPLMAGSGLGGKKRYLEGFDTYFRMTSLLDFENEFKDSIVKLSREDRAWLNRQFFILRNLPGGTSVEQDVVSLTIQRRRELGQVIRRHAR